MATIGTGTVSYLNTPRISYITTTAFQNDIFQYTTSLNAQFQTTGTLTSLATVGTATAANCPANRILRENGKKLYPSGLIVANNTTYGAPNPGVTTYMVGVYDPVSFLSGYIDPNSKVFAPYNTDKPEYVPRGINPNGNTEIDEGPPVYTLGAVKAGTTVSAGTSISATTSITAGTTLTATSLVVQNPVALTQATTSTLTMDCSLGSYFTVATGTSDNFSIQASNVTPGQIVVVVFNVNAAAVTPTITFGNNIRENQTASSLVITSARQATVTYIGLSTYLLETSRVAINTTG